MNQMLSPQLLRALTRTSSRYVSTNMNLKLSRSSASAFTQQVRQIQTLRNNTLKQSRISNLVHNQTISTLLNKTNRVHFSSKPETPTPEPDLTPDEIKKLSTIKMVKYMFKKYSYFFLFFYFGLYFVFLALIFAIVQSGIAFTANDILDLAKGWGLLSESIQNRIEYFNSIGYDWTLNFGAAWVATKFTEPIRLILTLYFTPRTAEAFKKWRAGRGGSGLKKNLLPILLLAALPSNSPTEANKQ